MAPICLLGVAMAEGGERVEKMTLLMGNMSHIWHRPASLAWRRAASVSAVSPDWEMTMTTSSAGRSTTERYLAI